MTSTGNRGIVFFGLSTSRKSCVGEAAPGAAGPAPNGGITEEIAAATLGDTAWTGPSGASAGAAGFAAGPGASTIAEASLVFETASGPGPPRVAGMGA